MTLTHDSQHDNSSGAAAEIELDSARQTGEVETFISKEGRWYNPIRAALPLQHSHSPNRLSFLGGREQPSISMSSVHEAL